MKCWKEDELRMKIKKETEEISRIKREIYDLATLLSYHKGRLEYLEKLSVKQTKINFDENDTNQY